MNIDKLLFIPTVGNVKETPNQFQDVWIGDIHGWLYEPYQDSSTPIILHCHGNAGNINNHYFDALSLARRIKMNIIIFDYRGYGKSKLKDNNHPSEDTIKRDAQTVYDWLVHYKLYNPNRIILYGKSMGGCAATHVAKRNMCRCLILDATFSSLYDVVESKPLGYILKFLCKTMFIKDIDICSDLKNISVNVLIIHSEIDEIIPYQCALKNSEHGYDLFTIKDKYHNGMLYHMEDEQLLGAIEKIVG